MGALVLGSVLTTSAIGSDQERRYLSGPGSLHIRVQDEATSKGLSARVQVLPRSLLSKPKVLLASDGALALEVADGSYDIVVSHGPEWSLTKRRASVRAGEVTHLTARLRREVSADDLTGCDLHVHSEHSPDSKLPLPERLRSLEAEGVQFAVLSDHNHVAKVEPSAPGDVQLLAGVEVTTWAPEFGHFNVFPRRSAPRYKHTNVHKLLSEVRLGEPSFVQINHPRLEQHIGYFALSRLDAASPQLPELGFDGLEVWNGWDLTRPERRDEIFHEWLALLARGKRLVATGGSDAHELGPPYVGYPRTYVDVPRAEASDSARVVAALKAGRAFVSNGPILRVSAEGAQPGDVLDLHGDQSQVQLTVQVAAPGWMDVSTLEVWEGTELAVEQPILRSGDEPLARTLHVTVPVRSPSTLVVAVRGERGMSELLMRESALPYAFSNPIWLRRAAPHAH